MLHIDRFTEILEDLAEELPEGFFYELNGGVNVLEEEKRHEESQPGDELYILGEYESGGPMGRVIYIYYGSFCRLFGDLPEAELVQEMRKTLRHEFRHHLEGLAGARDLEIEDEEYLAQYLYGEDD